jgi:hypothetical protein
MKAKSVVPDVGVGAVEDLAARLQAAVLEYEVRHLSRAALLGVVSPEPIRPAVPDHARSLKTDLSRTGSCLATTDLRQWLVDFICEPPLLRVSMSKAVPLAVTTTVNPCDSEDFAVDSNRRNSPASGGHSCHCLANLGRLPSAWSIAAAES